MKVAAINALPYGSTGNIMKEIGVEAEKGNIEYYSYYGAWAGKEYQSVNVTRFGTKIENIFSAILCRVSGVQYVYSIYGTRQLIKKLKEYKPDIIHLHNLHLWVINVPMLFKYIKENNISVVWTLHDCWSFTGQCPHFTMAGCDKWKRGCKGCIQYKRYPSTLVDRAALMWKLKKKWFSDVKEMTIVTPSKWLANLCRQSYLKKYDIKVINNGIDLNIFKPRSNEFRIKYGIPEDKIIVLGVAFGWGISKGLDTFIELSNRLDDSKYQVVLVGTDNKIDRGLPSNIISIHKTANQIELAEIYTAANMFVNPTLEENYPTVNMEALACGTPVITYKTGGSAEIIDDTCGICVERGDVETLLNAVEEMSDKKKNLMNACIDRSKGFSKNDRFKEYIDLYRGIIQQ